MVEDSRPVPDGEDRVNQRIVFTDEAARKMFYRPGTQITRSPSAHAAALLAAVRRDVIAKWQEQHHEMELSNYRVTYGFIGKEEW